VQAIDFLEKMLQLHLEKLLVEAVKACLSEGGVEVSF
jgi:hypothetical protein